jgi:hypothetical protein
MIFESYRGRFTPGHRYLSWCRDTQLDSRAGDLNNFDFDIAGYDNRFARPPPDY